MGSTLPSLKDEEMVIWGAEGTCPVHLGGTAFRRLIQILASQPLHSAVSTSPSLTRSRTLNRRPWWRVVSMYRFVISQHKSKIKICKITGWGTLTWKRAQAVPIQNGRQCQQWQVDCYWFQVSHGHCAQGLVTWSNDKGSCPEFYFFIQICGLSSSLLLLRRCQ
jgi:hypothetical protein